ncbi:hypothetical protein FACS1894122_07270 [Alphaproteobacteria bacterium]|nr:hypothetical protein FACS1894122_07270 [Alphaproteobacteria bacterium]
MASKKIELHIVCLLKSETEKDLHCCKLVKHLSMCGITADLEYRDISNIEFSMRNLVLLCSSYAAKKLMEKHPEQIRNIIFFADEALIGTGTKNICYGKPNNYYFATLELINIFHHSKQLEESVNDFKHSYHDKTSDLYVKNTSTPEAINWRKNKFFKFSSAAVVLIALVYGMLLLKNSDDTENIVLTTQFIGNDILLPREDIILAIDSAFQKQNGVKFAVLIGEGGAGKTVISRHYLQIKKINVKAEINAETRERISEAFLNLAIVLANTKELREKLSYIQTIPDHGVKNKQLISFVFSKLKTINNWCLLFDNVDDFDLIRDFIPNNDQSYRGGRVIITTRNENFKNIGSLPNGSIVNIGNLSPEEQTKLFSRISYGYQTQIPHNKLQEIKGFLKNIPLLPLDVCAAAYYLKNTHITFTEYLKISQMPDKISEEMQKTFLSEGINYHKSRYGIISSIFSIVLEVNHEFRELLLFTCLLDSQNIPTKLLTQYKDLSTVSAFIHSMKRFSMIADNEKSFSIHRNNQEIGLRYILSTISSQERAKYIDEIIKIMTPYESIAWNWYEKYSSKMSLAERKDFVIHAKSLLKKIESCSLADSQHKYETMLLLSILYAYADMEPYDKMHELAEKILRLNNGNNCIKDIDLAVLLLYNAHLSRNCDKKRCEELCKKCVAFCDKLSEANNIATMAKIYLARLYFDDGNFEKALELLNEIEERITLGISSNAKSIYAAIVNQFFICSINYYVNKTITYDRVKYLEKALDISGGGKMCHESGIKVAELLSNDVIISDIISLRLNLIRTYNVFGETQKAMRNCTEIKFLYDQMDKMGIVPPVQSLIFKKEYAHTLLRNNNVEEAYKILADVLKATSLHKSMCSFFVAIVYKSEADIRLNKFEEAYEDCKLVLVASGDKSNYAKLITCQCLYNMAISKYKMLDNKTAIKHFEEFFKASREFCEDFLDKNVFEQLKSQNTFEITKDTYAINTYLKHSLKIFTAIYGADHPFVKDFVAKQCVANSVH